MRHYLAPRQRTSNRCAEQSLDRIMVSLAALRGRLNQPGVEFHLRLDSECSLGTPGRWYGWQCKWYDLPSDRALGNTRRTQIKRAVELTEEILPDLTDWILWTRRVLTRRDQDWFFDLSTRFRLHSWNSIEIEEHLSGHGRLLRESYFGELVLTPELLRDHHGASTEHIRGRWVPEAHQVTNLERNIHRDLCAQGLVDLETAAGVRRSWNKTNQRWHSNRESHSIQFAVHPGVQCSDCPLPIVATCCTCSEGGPL